MRALTVLYGGRLDERAFEPVFSGKNAILRAAEKASSFPHSGETVLLLRDDGADASLPAELPGIRAVKAPVWTRKKLLDTLAELGRGFDITYFAWADCPLLDAELAGAIAERHLRYAAEYSYADGWPYGFAPEILSPGTAAILSKILGDEDGGPVERDTLFSLIQKDINSFDIETEISPVDLRSYRISLTADSKRSLLLLQRLIDAGLEKAADAASIIAGRPELLRTLPAFYPIQVSGACPQSCELCPYPRFGSVQGLPVTERTDLMDSRRFEDILDRIVLFSGDAVIDLSLWGELSLHPEKLRLIDMVLERPSLSLIIESSGLGWNRGELDAIAAKAAAALKRKNHLAPLSWIVSLDTADAERYEKIRGRGYVEAAETAKELQKRFGGNTYVQAVRTKGNEDDIERFYRVWKDQGVNIIIQKYDSFCGFLPSLTASDLSPVLRPCCWHLMRDFPILIDGSVPVCKEDVQGKTILGNVFSASLEEIWAQGENLYRDHCQKKYPGLCAECDEYYTYNF